MPTAIQSPVFVRIDANLPWRYTVGRGGNYVAVCDPLSLTVQAESWAALMGDIADVLDAILHDLMKTNELDRFLRDKGWAMIGNLPERQQEVRFDVPFFFVPQMAQEHGAQRDLR